jgi:hypothetical protein
MIAVSRVVFPESFCSYAGTSWACRMAMEYPFYDRSTGSIIPCDWFWASRGDHTCSIWGDVGCSRVGRGNSITSWHNKFISAVRYGVVGESNDVEDAVKSAEMVFWCTSYRLSRNIEFFVLLQVGTEGF